MGYDLEIAMRYIIASDVFYGRRRKVSQMTKLFIQTYKLEESLVKCKIL